MTDSFLKNIFHFEPHVFPANKGEGLYRSHKHKCDEIVIITDGEGYYTSNKGQNIHVTHGHILMIPPHLFHGFVCTKAWKGMSIHLLSQSMPHYCKYLLDQIYRKQSNKIIATQLNDRNLEKFINCINQMEEELLSKRPDSFYDDILRNSLEHMLLIFHRNLSQIEKEGKHLKNEEYLIEDILKEIHQNFHTPIKVSDLASYYYLSESSFRKKFKEYTGVSPKKYLINLRLDEAKRLLRQTEKPIEFISTEVGFSSSSRFHDLFMRREYVTPFEWRKQVRDC